MIIQNKPRYVVSLSRHERNDVENDFETCRITVGTSRWRIYSETPLGGLFLVWGSNRCRGRTIIKTAKHGLILTYFSHFSRTLNYINNKLSKCTSTRKSIDITYNVISTLSGEATYLTLSNYFKIMKRLLVSHIFFTKK